MVNIDMLLESRSSSELQQPDKVHDNEDAHEFVEREEYLEGDE